MLRQLLRLARDGSITDMVALARDLGVSIDELRQMIQQLEQFGYLERTVLGCPQPCERCALQPCCPASHAPRLWRITDKGERCLSSG
ncbi:MAG TPA: hypothetical protein VMT22_11930 [Terriglobales bacterium]|jgi:hypothetical protein|nr:hypothetical protein [Terriglobales bacterium]